MMVPSVTNAARRPASDSTVVSGRMPSSEVTAIGSPLRCLTLIGAISPSKTPSLAARAARWCDWAATSSWEARSMPRVRFLLSVDSPMDCPSKASVRPSCAATSRAWTVPYAQPCREPGSTCGARVMDSWPPATTTVASPLRIIRAASITAVRPGEADLVDGHRGDVPADAGADGALARRVLARSGLQDLAHDHAVHLLGLDAAGGQGRPDGVGAELDGGEAGQLPVQAALGGAGGGENDNIVVVCRIAHGVFFRSTSTYVYVIVSPVTYPFGPRSARSGPRSRPLTRSPRALPGAAREWLRQESGKIPPNSCLQSRRKWGRQVGCFAVS